MRFYTQQYRYYCGIDLHARSICVCILDQQGNILVHRNMPCGADLFLKAVAPYRERLAIAVECIFTWYCWAAHRSIFADQTGVCDYLKVMLKRMPAALIAGCHPPKH